MYVPFRESSNIGDLIMSKLLKGSIKEAFQHLKGWYQNAAEMQARPYHQMMERQTKKRVELYAEQAVYGEAFPANGTPFAIGNNQPNDGKLQAAVSLLCHGRCEGALGIQVEHIQVWLHGAKKAEDPKTATHHVGAGKMWYGYVCLCSSIWATDTIPQQMCWVITVLFPKGGGEYQGIGILEPIWKVLEKVMDLRLEAIILHNSLHGCLAMRGMGTGIIEAKLAQKLAHLEQMPSLASSLTCRRCLMPWIGAAASRYWRFTG
jgi:hypothetical protein